MSAIQALSKLFNVDKTIDPIQHIIKNSNNKFKIRSRITLGLQVIEDAHSLAKNTALNPNQEIFHHIEKHFSRKENTKRTTKQ